MKLHLLIVYSIIIGFNVSAQTDSAVLVKEYTPKIHGIFLTEQTDNSLAIYYFKGNTLTTDIYTDNGKVDEAITNKPEGAKRIGMLQKINISDDKYAIYENLKWGWDNIHISIFNINNRLLYKDISLPFDSKAILKNSTMKPQVDAAMSPQNSSDGYEIVDFIDNTLILKLKNFVPPFIPNTQWRYILTPAIINILDEEPKLKYIQPVLPSEEKESTYKYFPWQWEGSLKNAHIFIQRSSNSAEAFQKLAIDTVVNTIAIVNDHSIVSKSFDIRLVAPGYLLLNDYISIIDNKFEHCIYLFTSAKNIKTKEYTIITQKISLEGELTWQSIAPLELDENILRIKGDHISCFYDHNHSPYLFHMLTATRASFDKETGKSTVFEDKGGARKYYVETVSDDLRQKADKIKSRDPQITSLYEVFLQKDAIYMLFYCNKKKYRLYKIPVQQ